MSSAIEIQNTGSTSILEFPNASGTMVSDDTSALIFKALNHPSLEARLKDIVEGSVFSAIIKVLAEQQIVDDPYDAVFLLDLEPDEIRKSTLGNLLKGAGKIEDRSGEIAFNDILSD